MILCESTKLYPVYTSHVYDVYAISRRVDLLIRKRQENGDPDGKLAFLLDLSDRLNNLIYLLDFAEGEIAYLQEKERKLIGKVVDWVKAHPGDRSA